MKGYLQKYIDQGYSIFPCVKKNKSPLTKNGFYDATNNPETIKKQFYNDDLLIGLPTGQKNKIIVIDFDINKKIPKTEEIDPRTVDELIDEIKQNYGEMPDTFQVETPSGGRHFYFSISNEIELKSGTRFIDKFLPIDIRAEGGYVIAPDNINYTVYDDVDELDINSLQERCIPIPQWIIDIRKNKSEPYIISENKTENLPPEEIREIRSALSYLSSDDRDTWVKIGLALKSTGSPSAYGLWNEWSKTSNKYNPNDMEKRWDTLKPNDISIATLFHESKKNGWITTYEKNKLPEAYSISSNELPDPNKIKQLQKQYRKKPFPDDLLRPNGLVGDIIDYILDRSLFPQPIFALSSSLASVGALAGRKVRTETDIRTNIYCLNVGGAGCGKEMPRKVIKDLFRKSGCGNMCGVSDLASDVAIITAMYENNSQVFLIDEIGKFIEATQNGKSPTHLSKITEVLLKMYSEPDQTYSGKDYADKEKKVVIEQPNLCLLGTTVPTNLYKGLSYENAVDGFLSRMLIFETDDDIPELQCDKNVLIDPPIEIIDQVKALIRKPINMHPSGNIDLTPNPQIVRKTDDAKELSYNFYLYIRKLAIELRDKKQIYAIFMRASQLADQIALIIATGINIDNPIITEYEITYGIRLAEYLCKYMQYIVENFVARNETEHELKRVLKIIRESGCISHEEISKEMQHLKSYEANDILSKLAAQNRIHQQIVGEGEFAKIMITAK